MMQRLLLGLLGALMLGNPGWAQALRIYTEISPPDQFLGPDGRVTGYACEVVREIQKRVGSTDPIRVVPWVRGYQELLHRPDVVLFAMARSQERESLFQWVGPIRESVFSFYVRSDSGIQLENLEDAKRLNLIGVYKEDVRDQFLTAQGFTNLDRSIDNRVAFQKLLTGRIEGMVSTEIEVADLARSLGVAPDAVRAVLPVFRTQLYIAFSRETSPDTVQSWARALRGMRKDGSLDRIYQKYLPQGVKMEIP